MRKRKREPTHQLVVYKFRCYLRNGEASQTGHMLPNAIYRFAGRQQETWNVLAAERERSWNSGKRHIRRRPCDLQSWCHRAIALSI